MELSSPTISLLATGAIAGYFIGYIVKKLLHLAFTIGVFAFLLMYMVHIEAGGYTETKKIAVVK